MAHFAEIDNNNVVLRVITVSNEDIIKDGIEDEATGIAFCQSLLGGNWKQTSYNNNIRYHYAGIGYIYDPDRNAFYSPSPYPSWTLNDSCDWEAPIPIPETGGPWIWDEATLSWIVAE